MRSYGRYRVERPLGEGAGSKVYVAFDPKLGRQVAVKVLAADAEPNRRERFLREARVIATLRHPNIVALLDYSGEEDEALFLVMEYVPGCSLYKLTAEHGPMSESTALCVGHELSLALQHAHEAGIVHRDIKPENILLHEGRVVLMDFGGVKVFNAQGSSLESDTDVLGTPGFMAPEQFAGRGIGPATDIFSLGAALYNLSTGCIPYDGGSVDGTYRNLKAGKCRDPRLHRQILSREFSRLLARCLAPDPEDRFPSAASLRDGIEELLETHGISELRQELKGYERSPANYVVAQRERVVDNLVSQLRTALGDHELDRAHMLVERIRVLAPVDERVARITSGGSRLARTHNPRAAFRLGLWRGALLGLALGVLATLLLERCA